MLIPSPLGPIPYVLASLSRRVNANSQLKQTGVQSNGKLIKKGEC